MKKIIIISMLMTLTGFVFGQKYIKLTDTYNGKPVTVHSKNLLAVAYEETKKIYVAGMSEDAFVNRCLSNIPSQYQDFKNAYVPYAKYLYSIHNNNYTKEQALSNDTGVEFVNNVNSLIDWRTAHPGDNPIYRPWWRNVIHWVAIVFTWLDENLPE